MTITSNGVMMFIKNDPYWFNEESINKMEKHYGAKYIGAWCTKRPSGGWNEMPVEVFYQSDPDRSKGHSNFLGIFMQNGQLYVLNAESAFSEPITGVLCENGEVVVSRYRHNYIEKNGIMIDGGRDYIRSSAGATYVNVIMQNGNFLFNELPREEN
jgi:hypothetical protein